MSPRQSAICVVTRRVRGSLFPFGGTYSQEDVCVLLGHRYKHYYVITHTPSITNRSSSPGSTFVVLRNDLAKVLKQEALHGERVLGFVHRHPPGYVQPSPTDIRGIRPGLIGAVWCEGEITWYRSTGLFTPRFVYT